MQPILIVVTSAIGLAIAVWVARSVLRTVFRARAGNSLGVVLIVAGIVLFFFRIISAAIPLLILGTVLLLTKQTPMAQGQTTRLSKVRSEHLEMTLNHETGEIDGCILTGKRQGQVLSNLTLHELLSYYAEVQADEESATLFETFLDNAHPNWRVQMNERSAHTEETSPLSTQLSRDEAYQVLGLEAGCSDEDIRKAYHRLIKRVHPDSGGSAVLTAQITAARNKLLGDRP